MSRSLITFRQRVSAYVFRNCLQTLNVSDLADLLNVRLQTLGVAEHSFDIELCGSRYNWLMYDVGGAVRVCLFFLFYCLAQQGSTLIFSVARRVHDI